MRSRKTLTLILLMATQALQSETSLGAFHGSVEPVARYFDNDIDWTGGFLNLKYDTDFGESSDPFAVLQRKSQFRLNFRAQTFLTSGAATGRSESYVLGDLRELTYEHVFSQQWSLKAGQTILIWGKADQINPLDVWNGENFRFFLLEEKFRRKRARPMLIGNLFQGDWQIQAVAAPVLEETFARFPNAASTWCYRDCLLTKGSFIDSSLASQGISSRTVETDRFWSQTPWETGLRVQGRHGSYDFSGLVFSGVQKYPLFERSFPGVGQVRFERTTRPIFSVGGDVSTTFGTWAARAELKWTADTFFNINPAAPSFLSDPDGLEAIEEWEGIVSVDRQFLTKGYVNVQMYQRHSPQSLNSLIVPRGRSLGSVLVRWDLRPELWRIKARCYASFEDKSEYAELEAEWLLSDDSQISLGLFRFFGNKNQQGLFDRWADELGSQMRAQFQF